MQNKLKLVDLELTLRGILNVLEWFKDKKRKVINWEKLYALSGDDINMSKRAKFLTRMTVLKPVVLYVLPLAIFVYGLKIFFEEEITFKLIAY